jgi:outer membrane protein assembly factor BamD (BamD/ComL family)
VEPERPVDSLQAEVASLRSAQRALRSGDARRALELLTQQDSAFREGALAEERSAARVLALCQAHEVSAARNEARRFEERYPTSALLGKVRSACRDR